MIQYGQGREREAAPVLKVRTRPQNISTSPRLRGEKKTGYKGKGSRKERMDEGVGIGRRTPTFAEPGAKL